MFRHSVWIPLCPPKNKPWMRNSSSIRCQPLKVTNKKRAPPFAMHAHGKSLQTSKLSMTPTKMTSTRAKCLWWKARHNKIIPKEIPNLKRQGKCSIKCVREPRDQLVGAVELGRMLSIYRNQRTSSSNVMNSRPEDWHQQLRMGKDSRESGMTYSNNTSYCKLMWRITCNQITNGRWWCLSIRSKVS